MKDYVKLLNAGAFPPNVGAMQFWQEKLGRFPNLAPLGLAYQCMPAKSASSERLFSCAGLSCKGKKTNVSTILLEAQTICRFNKKFFDY